MARVFGIDVLAFPRCKSKLQVLSFITEPDVIKNILKSIGMATAPPKMARSNFVSEQTDITYQYDATPSRLRALAGDWRGLL